MKLLSIGYWILTFNYYLYLVFILLFSTVTGCPLCGIYLSLNESLRQENLASIYSKSICTKFIVQRYRIVDIMIHDIMHSYSYKAYDKKYEFTIIFIIFEITSTVKLCNSHWLSAVLFGSYLKKDYRMICETWKIGWTFCMYKCVCSNCFSTTKLWTHTKWFIISLYRIIPILE